MLKSNNVASELVFFDVDGTLTSKDTLLLFLHYAGGARFYLTLPVLCLCYALFRMHLLSAQKSKELILSFVFRGCSQKNLEEKGTLFIKYILNDEKKYFRKNALKTLQKHAHNSRVVLVSASPELWICPLAQQLGVEYIATKLFFAEGKFSGFFLGKNCNGLEKVERIKKYIPNYSQHVITAYGDSSGDKPMLSLAKHAIYKPFREGE